MKTTLVFALIAPTLSQFCSNSPQVQVCAQEIQGHILSCNGVPQCACEHTQRLLACYQGCQSDPNYMQQIAGINAQSAQYCSGGMGGFNGGMGAFPSGIPGGFNNGWNRPPSFNSANVNSGMLEATATFRSGNMNSRSFRNSGTNLKPAAILIPIVAVITGIIIS